MLAFAFFSSVVVPPSCGPSSSTSVQIQCESVENTHLYEVSVGTNASSILTVPWSAVTSTRPSITISDLKPNTTYYFKARSHATADLSGGTRQMIMAWSNFTDAIPCRTKATTRGAPFSIHNCSIDDQSIEVRWVDTSVRQYRVFHREAGTVERAWTAVETSSSSARLQNLKSGTTYNIKIAALADGIEGAPSDVINFTTRRAATQTSWIEVYRVAENDLTWPDYLANHNSGSGDGDTAFLTGAGGGGRNASHFFNFDSSPRVRYCVEIETVNLSHIPRWVMFFYSATIFLHLRVKVHDRTGPTVPAYHKTSFSSPAQYQWGMGGGTECNCILICVPCVCFALLCFASVQHTLRTTVHPYQCQLLRVPVLQWRPSKPLAEAELHLHM